MGARRTLIQHFGKVEAPGAEAMTHPRCGTGMNPGRLVREFLDKQGIRPRKSLGQHFLVDSSALRRIIDAAELSSVDTVVEVGPGPGVLTRELLRKAGSVIAVEKDESIAEGLQQAHLGDPKIRILAGDMLEVDLRELTGGAPYKVVANLPYYVAAPILRRFLEAGSPPLRLVLLLQREVAESIVAKPGDMSMISVATQVYAAGHIVSHVKPGSFYPAPKVDSSILRLDPYERPRVFDRENADSFFNIARAGFRARRKQIANSLSLGLGIERELIISALISAGIDPKRRAETLSVEEWGELHRALGETEAHEA